MMAQRNSFLLAFGLAAIGSLPLPASAAATYLLQLGSFPTEEAAKEKWESLQKAFPKELEGLDHRFSQVPISGDRSIYRLQAGPIEAKDIASARCAALASVKQDCYLVETAVLSGEAPSQALSSVRATQSGEANGELQLGRDGQGENGVMRLDTALPRPAASEAPKSAPASVSPNTSSSDSTGSDSLGLMPSEETQVPAFSLGNADSVDEAFRMSAATPESAISFRDAPESNPASEPAPAESAPKAFSTGAPEPASAPTAEIPAPSAQPAIRMLPPPVAPRGPRVALQKTPTPPPSGVSEPPVARDYIAPATSPMGSLGTLRVSAQGEVTGIGGVSNIMVAQPPIPAETPMTPIASSFPSASPVPASPVLTSPAHAVPVDTSFLTPSQARDVKVEVKEAVRIREGETPIQPIMAPGTSTPGIANGQPPETAHPFSTTPEPWRGTPSSRLSHDQIWAQFGQFVQEAAAFRYFDDLRARHPEMTSGVRVRATRPYGNLNVGSHVSLRVGPYRTENEVNALCAVIVEQRIPCNIARDAGLDNFNPGLRGENAPLSRPMAPSRFAAMAATSRAMPFGKPTPVGGALANPEMAAPALPSSDTLGEAGQVWAQIGSFASESEAYNRYSALQSSQPQLMRGTRPEVVAPKASSSGRTTYRLRAGPFPSKEAALTFCGGLAQKGTACLIAE